MNGSTARASNFLNNRERYNMKTYQDLCSQILAMCELRQNRTGTDAVGIFGGEFTHDLQDGFPLLTTKKMGIRSIEAELVAFIHGKTNVKDFNELGTTIWDENAFSPYWLANPFNKGDGDLGPIYGSQWRRWESIKIIRGWDDPNPEGTYQALAASGYTLIVDSYGDEGERIVVMRKEIDQLQNLIDGIKKDPFGRRHIVSAWNPGEIDKMALPPCHVMFQCYVREGKYLDLKMYQRSADTFLGVPYNIASYAMLAHMLAELTDLKPGKLTISFGDLHIYMNHVEQIREQVKREPKPLPELTVRRIKNLADVQPGVFQLHGYESHPALKGKMAV